MVRMMMMIMKMMIMMMVITLTNSCKEEGGRLARSFYLNVDKNDCVEKRSGEKDCICAL